jgi:hypothetical protein
VRPSICRFAANLSKKKTFTYATLSGEKRMSRTRYKILPDDPFPYFLTLTTVNWLPLFSHPKAAAILLESLVHMQKNQRFKLYAYVIMETHLHLIAECPDLSQQIANFKSFTARKMIDAYQQDHNQFILQQLAE